MKIGLAVESLEPHKGALCVLVRETCRLKETVAATAEIGRRAKLTLWHTPKLMPVITPPRRDQQVIHPRRACSQLATARPASMSAIKSVTASSPTDSRNMPSLMPNSARASGDSRW